MQISGLQKVTLLDYPGHIACTIFFGKCNLRCPFCHNMELVEHPEHFPTFSMESILEFLKERKGKLNGVAITGGEPLLNNDIGDLLKPIKELGYPIKLDTNGFMPDMIERLIDEELVDKFAMDIKSGFSNYLKVSGVSEPVGAASNTVGASDIVGASYASQNVGADTIRPTTFTDWKERIQQSISLLMNKSKDYEFRTTCVKGLHTKDDFLEIKEMISGAKEYYLQNYKAAPNMENLPFKPFAREELEEFANIVRDNVGFVDIRGI